MTADGSTVGDGDEDAADGDSPSQDQGGSNDPSNAGDVDPTTAATAAASATGGAAGTAAIVPLGKVMPSRSPEPPYVRLEASQVRTRGRCEFKACPSDKPFVYYLTSYRNRGAPFNRWLRSVLGDVQSDVNTFPVQCLCIGVADYNDVVTGVPLDVALEDWPYDKAVISLHGNFSRAGGFQRAIDHLVTTPKT